MVDKYIDAAATPGGNDGSQGNPYANWSEFEAAEQAGFNAGSEPMNVFFKDGLYTFGINLPNGGWQTAAGKELSIKSWDGTPPTGFDVGVRFQANVSGGIIQSAIPYFTIEDCSLDSSIAATSSRHGLNILGTGAFNVARRIRIKTGSGAASSGVVLTSGPDDVILESIDVSFAQGDGIQAGGFNERLQVRNCTVMNVIGNGYALSSSPGGRVFEYHNSVAHNCGTDWESDITNNAFFNFSNNASSDGTAPAGGTVVTSLDADFTSVTVDGSHEPTAAGQLDGAGNNAEVAASPPLNTGAWENPPSIGAWEVAAAGPTPPAPDAGGPYSGQVNTPIAVAATVNPGSDPSPDLAWTADGPGNFGDPSLASTTFTPTNLGAYVLTFTVTPNDGPPVADTADLTSNADVGDGTLTTVFVDNAGTPVANATGITVYCNNTTDAVLAALFTNQATDGTGRWTVTSSNLVPGNTYHIYALDGANAGVEQTVTAT